MTDENERFLSRWSRLKRTGEQADPGPAATDLPAERVGTEARSEAEPAESEGGAVAPPDLPTIESLDTSSDFSVFMQQGVPEELRKLALRKLWRISPGEIDGLDDYDEDYALIEMVLEKAPDVDQVAKDMPGGETEKTLAAEDGAADEVPRPPDGATEAAQPTEAAEELAADSAAAEGPPDEPDKT
jgi:hypothetical protein